MADPIEVITAEQLLAYLGGEASGFTTELLANGVTLTNRYVTEKWANPVDPVPVSIELIALEVAGRAARNPKGLASWTKSADDASKTERLPETYSRAGIFFTPAELRTLSGRRKRSRMGTIRTTLGY